MRYYKKKYGKEVYIKYHPLGMLYLTSNSTKQYSHTFYFVKLIKDENPDVKVLMIFSIFGHNKIFCDPLMSKLITQNSDLYKKVKLPGKDSYGIFEAVGKEHKRQRNQFAHKFKFENLVSNVGIIKDCTEQLLNNLQLDGKSPFDSLIEMQKLLADVTLKSFIQDIDLENLKIEGEKFSLVLQYFLITLFAENIKPRMYILNNLIFKKQNVPKFLLTKPLLNASQKYDKIKLKLFELIDKRKEQLKDKKQTFDDFLSVYFDDQNEINKDEVFGQLIVLFAAGMDTTSNLLAMTFYVLAMYPEIQKKCVEEVDSLFENPEQLDHKDLNNLKYMNMVLKETLRMYGPSPGIFPRIPLNNHKIDKFEVNKGDIMGVLFVDGLNDKYFPDAQQFKPERWNDEKVLKDQFSYIPFSSGSRNCIGQYLAMIEAKVVLTYILKRYEIIRNENVPLVMHVSFIFGPKDDKLVILKEKSK